MSLLDQTVYWIDAEGTRVELADMSLRRKRNLKAWLLRMAPKLREREIRGMYQYAPQGDIASMDWDQAIEEMWDEDPEEWIKAKPLYRRLNQLIASDIFVYGEHDSTPPTPPWEAPQMTQLEDSIEQTKPQFLDRVTISLPVNQRTTGLISELASVLAKEMVLAMEADNDGVAAELDQSLRLLVMANKQYRNSNPF